MRLLAIATWLLLSLTAMTAGQNGNDLYQQGLARETAGDLKGAIQIFERIVRDPSANRPLAARALMQLGQWSELLGQDQARKYYDRVVREYGDQSELAAEARKRLAVKSKIQIATPFTNDPWSFALSPDGRSLVFVATVDGKTSLWLRPQLDSPKQAPIPGTESSRYGNPAVGANPFWSPDGRFIGYFEDRKLKTIPAGGGTAKTLADAPANTGGAWSRTGDIVFGPNIFSNLFRVRADGCCAPEAVTSLVRPVGAHRYPRFLDDRRFLYVGVSLNPLRLLVGSLDGAEKRSIALQLGGAAFAPPDYLLFASDGALYAQRLDVERLELPGRSVRLAARVASQYPWVGYNAFSVSAAGSIAYRDDLSPRRRLFWSDRAGREVGSLIQSGSFMGVPRFSPDGRSVALFQDQKALLVEVRDGQSRRLDLGSLISVGFASPIWSPGGESIAFERQLSASTFGDIYERPLNGSNPNRTLRVQTRQHKQPLDWYGDVLLFSATNSSTASDLLIQHLQEAGEPVPVAVSAAREAAGRFAPGGNWIAYQSNEVGERNEIFVQPFPGSIGLRRRVSVDGGSMPEWSRNGRELYFLSPDNRLMVAAITVSSDGKDIEIGKPAPLFASPLPVGSTYAPAPDGQRFLISQPIEAAPPIIVLRNVVGANGAKP